MAKDRSLVRASDIGAWAYCRRAWWLAQVKEVPHQRPEVLAAGTAAHEAHGRQVRVAGRMQRVGLWLVGMGVLLLGLAALYLWLIGF